MAEVIDGIEYEVNADTKGLNQSTNKVDTSTKKMEGSFKRLDTQVTQSAKNVRTGLSRMSQSAGQAGIQFQQFVGQVQGGTNVMTALSQQGADLGIALGAPLVGVIVSLGAVLGGVLFNALSGTSDEVEELTEKLKELVKTSTLTEAQAAVLTRTENESIEAKSKLRGEVLGEIKALEGSIGAYDKLNARKEAGDRLTVSERDSLYRLGQELKENQKSLDENQALYDTLGQEIESAQKKIELYNNAIADSATQNQKQKESVVQLIASAQFQAETFGKSAREIALYTAQLNNASEGQIEALNRTFDQIDAMQAEKEERAALNAQFRETVKAIDAEAKARQRAEEQKQKKATSFAEGVVQQGLSEPERLQQDMDKLEQLRQEDLINEELYQQAKTSIVKQQNEERQKAEALAQNAILMSSASFFDAAAGLASTFAGEQSGAYKALFALSKGFAIANAALNLQTAISNASALPWPTNIPAIAQAATQGAAIASNLAGLTYSGGRQYGGPTSAGGIYQTGELNRPEMLTEGGKQYLIPGNRGNVTPLEGMGGVTVNNTIVAPPGMTADISSNTSGDGMTVDQVIKIIEAQTANPGSRTNQNLRKTNTLAPRQGASRRTGS